MPRFAAFRTALATVGAFALLAGGVVTTPAVSLAEPTSVVASDSPVTAAAAEGFWTVGADGHVASAGGAPHFGDTSALRLNRPIVGMASTASGQGYWLVASDGGIFTFGDAAFWGSTGHLSLNQPIVGMAPTASGLGYWMVASDGGIFTFGDAAFLGSTGDLRLNMPIVGMMASDQQNGYHLIASDGGLFAFGDAVFAGSGAGRSASPFVGGFLSASGAGYVLITTAGEDLAFGDVPSFEVTARRGGVVSVASVTKRRSSSALPTTTTARPPTTTTTTRPPTTTTRPPTTTTAPPAPPANLLWSDEFDTLDLSTSTHAGAWRPNDFWQDVNRGYRDFAGSSWNLNPNEHPGYSPFSVNNGVLSIKARRTPAELRSSIASSMAAQGQWGEVPEWSGGMLISNRDARTMHYGYLEIRASLPTTGKGMFPALWLFAADQGDNPLGKGSAEIDVLEVFGHAGGNLWDSNLHFRNNSGSEVRTNRHTTMNTDTVGWHTYGLDWQPNYLRFYQDGVLVWEVTGADAAWFNTRMTVRLNYAMDASWFSGFDTRSDWTTPAELRMEIDYVRAFAARP